MRNQMSQHQQEEYLNDFIDSLITECKPVPPTSMDQEFAAMMETVRGVKRLRSEKELLADMAAVGQNTLTAKAVDAENPKPSWRKRWISGAAVAATLFLAFGIFSQMNRMTPVMEAAEEAPAMLRSAEVAEMAEDTEAVPEAAAKDTAPEMAASEAPPDTAPGEAPMTMEAPAAGDDSVSMYGIQEAMPTAGVAIIIKQIDTSYVEMNLINVPAHYQAFKLTEELKNTLTDKPVEQGALYAVSFEVEEGEIPVLTTLESIEEAVLEARYLGRADSNFAEFLINGKVQVIALSEETKVEAEALESQLNALPEGVLTMITVKGSEYSTSGIVTQIEKISD